MSTTGPALSILIPAYNEEARLPATLLKIEKYLSAIQEITAEIVIVDDGSEDATSNAVQDFIHLSSQNVIFKKHPYNMGKGAAIKTAINNSSGAYLLIFDADSSTEISEIEKLWSKKSKDTIVIGSRAIPNSETQLRARLTRKILGRIFNFFVNTFLIKNIYDSQCGFKLFSREASAKIFSKMKMDRYSFDLEMLFLAKKLGFKIEEVPVNWQHVSGSKVNVFSDGIGMLIDIFKIKNLHK